MRGLWCTLMLVATQAGAAAASDVELGSGTPDVGKLYRNVQNATADAKPQANLKLAQALRAAGFPITSSSYFAAALDAGPRSQIYVEGLGGLLRAQSEVDDEYLIPTLIAAADGDAVAKLKPEQFARANFLLGAIAERKGELEKARVLLSAVRANQPIYAKAHYLLGVVLVDPRFPGGARGQEAVQAFQAVLNLADDTQEGLEKAQDLARLALARTYYNLQRYPDSVQEYDRVPRFARYWDQALFENGFARFRNEDLGGALGSLQSLHAPQFEGSFLPESWILKSTIYFFSCLYDESLSALAAYDQVYGPMMAQLKPIATDDRRAPLDYYRLVAEPQSDAVPRPVLRWVRNNERLLGVFRLLAQMDKERDGLASLNGVAGTPAQAALIATLATNKATAAQVAGQLAKNRLTEAYKSLKSFSEQAEIIRFETTKAEKELVESGVDQKKILASQRIHRPRMPGEDYDYWSFDGEFWSDEIGAYRYTLKNGCPAQAGKQ